MQSCMAQEMNLSDAEEVYRSVHVGCLLLVVKLWVILWLYCGFHNRKSYINLLPCPGQEGQSPIPAMILLLLVTNSAGH